MKEEYLRKLLSWNNKKQIDAYVIGVFFNHIDTW
jgi:hypothetical protein